MDRSTGRSLSEFAATFLWSTLDQVEREAMALSPAERARLADRLWESVAGNAAFEVVMTPELERLLDEGLKHVGQAKSTDALRHPSGSVQG